MDYDPAVDPVILSLIPNQNKNGSSIITLIVKDDGGTVGAVLIQPLFLLIQIYYR